MVTGAGGGIGLPLVDLLLRSGAVVIAHTRRPIAPGTPLADLAARYPGRLLPEHADLDDRGAVARMIAHIRDTEERLDALCNNAAIGYTAARAVNDQGIERVWSVNVVAPRQLAVGLAPLLARGRTPRVVNVVSGLLHELPLDLLEQLSGAASGRSWDGAQAYGRSKQGMIIWTAAADALSRAGSGSPAGSGGFAGASGPVRYLAVDPGTIDTPMAAGFPFPLRGAPPARAARLLARLLADPAMAADGTVHYRVGRRSVLPDQAADVLFRERLLQQLDSLWQPPPTTPS